MISMGRLAGWGSVICGCIAMPLEVSDGHYALAAASLAGILLVGLLLTTHRRG